MTATRVHSELPAPSSDETRSVVADRLGAVLDAGDLEVRWSPRLHLATGTIHSYRAELAWKDREQAWFRGPGLMTLFARAGLAPEMVAYVSAAARQLDAKVVFELDAEVLLDAAAAVTAVPTGAIVLVSAPSIARAGTDAIGALREVANAGVDIGLSGLPVAPVAATLVDAVRAAEIAVGRRGSPLPASDARALVLLARAARCCTSATDLSGPELVARAAQLGVDVGEGRGVPAGPGGEPGEMR